MSYESDRLVLFFEKNIFEADNDQLINTLNDYTDSQILNCLLNRLKVISSSVIDSYEIAWKLGRIFGEYECIQMDMYILTKLKSLDIDMLMACLNFLSGYWDEASSDLMSLRSFSSFVIESLTTKNWPEKLAELSIDAIAVAYGNNTSIFKEDEELFYSLSLIKKHVENSMRGTPGKDLLFRI